MSKLIFFMAFVGVLQVVTANSCNCNSTSEEIVTSPFIGNIFGPVETGHIFVIAGKTIDGASRLIINLKSGKGENAHIILHLSFRFCEDIIIRNSWTPNGWGMEESEQNVNNFTKPNPIVAGDNFKVYIFAGDTQFHIAINDQPYCVYNYRMSNQLIRTIEVTGDIQLVKQMDHRSTYPQSIPSVQQDPGHKEIYFSNDIPRRFSPGHVIVITGIPAGDPRGVFNFWFTEGATKRELLHFSSRFEPTFVAVRNAMDENLNFGSEDISGPFPFTVDEQFKLAIGMTETDFKFAINGKFFARFAYRTKNPLPLLNGFKLAGHHGMHVAITEVDHIVTDTMNCDDIVAMSQQESCVS